MGQRNLRLFCLSSATCCLASFVLVAAAVRLPAQPVATSPAQPSPAQIERWVENLSDDSYAVRKLAAENLLSAGPAARGPLRKVIDGPDPETRAAARRIATLIDSTDFRRRLEAFAADVDGRAGLSLPGWDLYRELVGGDARARALFVEMQRQESILLAATLGERPAVRDTAWEERLSQLVQGPMNFGGQNMSPPLASCAALLLVGTAPKAEISDRGCVQLSQLITRPPIQDAMQSGNHRDAVRRLVAAWIVHCPNNSDSSLHQRLSFAGANELAEAVPLAVSVATGEKAPRRASPAIRMTALLVVGQLGKREHVDRLEPLLDDAAICIPSGLMGPRAGGEGNVDVQIRDVALVVLLKLTDQNPADYGYLNAQVREERAMNAASVFPRNAEQRGVAIAKWRQWRAAQRGAKSDKR